MNTFLSCAVAAALLSAPAFAQSGTVTVFVGPNTSPNPSGVWAYDPMPTFQAGCGRAKEFVDLGLEVALCVFSGTYSDSSPFTLPSHGVRVTAFEGTTGGQTMPYLETNLVFDELGDTELRPSTVENLRFGGAVELNAGGHVQIRNCHFTYEMAPAIGVEISRPADTHSEHVIELCRFEASGTGPNQLVGVGNSGVEYLGTSSVLVRANTFRNLQKAVFMVGDALNLEANISPRIVSNAMTLHERAIEIEHARPWIVNNSIGEFKVHAGVVAGYEVFGIGFRDCPTAECSNNLVWFAPAAGVYSDMGDIYEGPNVGVLHQVTNHVEDDNVGAPAPFTTFPRINPTTALPVSSTFPTGGELGTGGTLALVLPAPSGPAPIANNDGGTVPVDLSIDFEGDMRITPTGSSSAPAVAIGCDQVVDVRLEVVPGGGVDVFGNWLAGYPASETPSLMPLPSFQVQATGLYPGSTSQSGVVGLMGTYFLDSQPSPVNAVDLHMFDAVMGSHTSNLNLVFAGFPQAQAVGNGQTTATFTVPATSVPTQLIGRRLFLQVFSAGRGGAIGVASNRVAVRGILNVLSSPL